MSGGPQGAKSGRFAIWLGGEEAIFNVRKQPSSDGARYIGPIGAGSVAPAPAQLRRLQQLLWSRNLHDHGLFELAPHLGATNVSGDLVKEL